MLTISDISFLSKKTKLSKERTHLLFEEKEDGDLVIQQLGSKRLTKKELIELSFLGPLEQLSICCLTT